MSAREGFVGWAGRFRRASSMPARGWRGHRWAENPVRDPVRQLKSLSRSSDLGFGRPLLLGLEMELREILVEVFQLGQPPRPRSYAESPSESRKSGPARSTLLLPWGRDGCGESRTIASICVGS